MEVTQVIALDRPYATPVLIWALEQEGARAELGPSTYYNLDISTDIQQLVVTLLAMGAPTAIKAGIAKFRKLVPAAEVTVKDKDEQPSSSEGTAARQEDSSPSADKGKPAN